MSVSSWVLGERPNRATIELYVAAVPCGLAALLGGPWLQQPGQGIAGGTCLVLLAGSGIARLVTENRRAGSTRRSGVTSDASRGWWALPGSNR
jgi:hypothetical protein